MGRPKGARNKRTLEIQERIDSEDPIGKLMKLAESTYNDQGQCNDPDLAIRCYKEVLPYGYARLAASTVDLASVRGDVTLNVKLDTRKPGKSPKRAK